MVKTVNVKESMENIENRIERSIEKDTKNL